jgi:hypothetical protein
MHALTRKFDKNLLEIIFHAYICIIVRYRTGVYVYMHGELDREAVLKKNEDVRSE